MFGISIDTGRYNGDYEIHDGYDTDRYSDNYTNTRRGADWYPSNAIGFTGGNEEMQKGSYRHYNDDIEPLSREKATKWIQGMKNSDGSRGARWTMDDVDALRQRMGMTNIKLPDLFTAMNMLYSDYGLTVRKAGADTPEFWAKMAADFIDDEDAMPNKLARYYQYIARK